jgi:hypothetical protein
MKCTICLDNIYPVELVAITECNHIFHRNCIKHWISDNLSCPLCRNSLEALPNHGNVIKTFILFLNDIHFTEGISILRNAQLRNVNRRQSGSVRLRYISRRSTRSFVRNNSIDYTLDDNTSYRDNDT